MTALGNSSGGEGNCMGDIDNDGDLDIVTAVGSSPYVKWYENNGSGGGWIPHDGPNTGNGDLCVRVADIDRDGRNELVVSHSEACGSVSFFASAAPKTGPWSEKAVYGTSSCGWHTLQIGDINSDGQPDILSAQMHGLIMVFYNPGGDSLGAWAFDQIATSGVHNGVLADVDRNGALDIVGCNYDGDSPVGMWYWQNGSPADGHSRHAVGDFDGDGNGRGGGGFRDGRSLDLGSRRLVPDQRRQSGEPDRGQCRRGRGGGDPGGFRLLRPLALERRSLESQVSGMNADNLSAG